MSEITPYKETADREQGRLELDNPSLSRFVHTRGIIRIPTDVIVEFVSEGNKVEIFTTQCGQDSTSMVSALETIISRLKADIDATADCIVGLFAGKNSTMHVSYVLDFFSRIKSVYETIEPAFGFYIDENLDAGQVEIVVAKSIR